MKSFEVTSSSQGEIAQVLVSRILEFPTFSDAKSMGIPAEDLLQKISEAYEDDNLTEEQDLAFEAVLYLTQITSEFDLVRAMEIWEDEDHQCFVRLLSEVRRMLQARPTDA